MKSMRLHQGGLAAVAAMFLAVSNPAWAAHHFGSRVEGIKLGSGAATINLTAKSGHISTADGNSVYFWGFATSPTGNPQYPGPTLIVEQDTVVTVNLNNTLPIPVSLLFPGQQVAASGGSDGMLTKEAVNAAAGTVTYTFTASKPGTYLYHSGSRQDLSIEMGLVGALIVRPTGFDDAPVELDINGNLVSGPDTNTWSAYGKSTAAGGTPAENQAYLDSKFGSEFLFLLTEMDESVHKTVEQQVRDIAAGVPGAKVDVDMTKWWPVYWFINGRTGPDTLLASGASALTPWLSNQPYNCAPNCHPGEKVLMRVIGAGRDAHPYHHHGNHARIIALDGNLLTSGEAGAGADLAFSVFTMPVTPGGTMDGIWYWTGEKLGWDAYGHKPGEPLAPNEYAPDHGKPLPTKLPPDQDLTFGQLYGGSPYLGSAGVLPPGEGGFNPNNGFAYMWHSHNEKEIVNNDIFPGGMLTLMLVEAWTVAP